MQQQQRNDSDTHLQLMEIFQAPEFERFVESYMPEVFSVSTNNEWNNPGATVLYYDPCDVTYNILENNLQYESSQEIFQEVPHHCCGGCNAWTNAPSIRKVNLTRTNKTKRLVWTKELHRYFLQVVNELGEDGSFSFFFFEINMMIFSRF